MVINITGDHMHIEYRNNEIEKICTDLNETKKTYPLKIAEKLLKAINFIKTAESLQDVIQYAPFHFHSLKGKRTGEYAVDVDGRRGSYRIIVRLTDEDTQDVYAIAKSVKIILILEVSKHYE